MNFSLFIAKRYLVSKKSLNVINLISIISVVGVMVGTMALIVILSVFNGLDGLVKSLFNSFDPDLRITLAQGKVFTIDERFEDIRKLDGVINLTEILEENALLQYGEKQQLGVIKGVGDEYKSMTGVDSMIIDGEFLLKDDRRSYSVIGQGVAYYLGVGLKFINPIEIWVTKRTKQVTFNPQDAFKTMQIYPSGVFAIQQDFDAEYVIVPIIYARELFDYLNEVSSVEIKLNPKLSGSDRSGVQKQIQSILGEKFVVKNRYQMNELLYKTMKSEKLAIFLILSFILVIASFNAIGSVTMLIIDKKNDIVTLRSLGATDTQIRRVFLFEGWMISVVGAILGLSLGALLCFAQIKFGFIPFPGDGTFIIDSYPVDMQLFDFISVFSTVLVIGFIAAWLPVRLISPKQIPVFDK